MINGAKNCTQTLDSFSDLFELRHGQEPRMNSRENNFAASEVTHQSVNGQIKLAIEPTRRQVHK